MPKTRGTSDPEIVTPPTPLPIPSPTYEKEDGERYDAQGEVITEPRNRYVGDTHAEIPEYEGSYFVTENGTIPCGGYEMISDLVVSVEPKGLTQITITENGTYKPTGFDGYSQVTVAIPTYSGSYSVTENATLPTKGKLMADDLTVNVPVGGNTLKTLLDATKNAYYLFDGYTGNAVVDLISYDDTSEVTNMGSMFAHCSNITSIPLLNTSKVTDMSYMFAHCSNITSIPLFDTSNVANMQYMFQNCSALTTIPLLDTSKVAYMNNMFYGCPSLTTLPLLDTAEVTNMSYMFYTCAALASVPLLNTSKVTNMGNMFRGCNSLVSIPALDASKVTNFTNTFSGCSALAEIHMTGMSADFNISASTQFTREALVEIITNCATVTSATLTMGSTNLAKLTQADIDAATAKGWTLA